MSFKVAVLGRHAGESWFNFKYGIQVFDLSVDQICSLLENTDPEKGISYAELGATPTVQYHVMGGGRFFPPVSRGEIAQAVQGVDILVTIPFLSPWFNDFFAETFLQHLINDNLLDKCKAVVVRFGKNSNPPAKPQTVEDYLKMIGLDVSNLNAKLYVLADKEVLQEKHKSKKKTKLDGDVTTSLAQLRSRLLGEEIKAALTAPVKETMSAGKALLDMGQRLTSWVTSFVKS